MVVGREVTVAVVGDDRTERFDSFFCADQGFWYCMQK